MGKTPLKYYTEYLYSKLYKTIRYNQTSEDYLGRFYGEFMSCSGGDGQSLGIVLTPKHICNLFCELIDLKPDDIVLDQTCPNMIQEISDIFARNPLIIGEI